MITKSPQTEALIGRIFNWKFDAAKQLAASLPATVISNDQRDILYALAAAFGNCGWIDGNMGIIIGCSVRELIGEEKE